MLDLDPDGCCLVKVAGGGGRACLLYFDFWWVVLLESCNVHTIPNDDAIGSPKGIGIIGVSIVNVEWSREVGVELPGMACVTFAAI